MTDFILDEDIADPDETARLIVEAHERWLKIKDQPTIERVIAAGDRNSLIIRHGLLLAKTVLKRF